MSDRLTLCLSNLSILKVLSDGASRIKAAITSIEMECAAFTIICSREEHGHENSSGGTFSCATHSSASFVGSNIHDTSHDEAAESTIFKSDAGEQSLRSAPPIFIQYRIHISGTSQTNIK